MELKRILGKDSRRALEEVSRQYGEDALVISSGKVNGQTEVIVAVDLEMDSQAPYPLQYEKQRNGNKPIDEKDNDFKKVLEYEMGPQINESGPIQLPNSIEKKTDKQNSDLEYLRMREIVDLIKLELASIRKEFKLSQKIGLIDGDISANKELVPLFRFFDESGIPTSLKSLLKSELVDENDLQFAIKKTKDILSNNLSITQIDWDSTKIHVLVGTSGSGKTTMAGKIATEITKNSSPDDVAIISFNDSKLGAWAQTQLIGAQSGIPTYRAENIQVLETLIDDLSHKKALIIDTPSANIKKHINEIEKLTTGTEFHLVVPCDASESSISNSLTLKKKGWSSVMISRAEDHVNPWSLISALAKSQVPISYIARGTSSLSGISVFKQEAILEHAMRPFPTDFDCGTLMAENKPDPDENRYETVLRKSNLEVKPGQIDPEKMLSDPLLMISKMVEKRHEVTEGV